MVLDLDVDEGAEDDGPGYFVCCSCGDGVTGERCEERADLGGTYRSENKDKERQGWETFERNHFRT